MDLNIHWRVTIWAQYLEHASGLGLIFIFQRTSFCSNKWNSECCSSLCLKTRLSHNLFYPLLSLWNATGSTCWNSTRESSDFCLLSDLFSVVISLWYVVFLSKVMKNKLLLPDDLQGQTSTLKEHLTTKKINKMWLTQLSKSWVATNQRIWTALFS